MNIEQANAIALSEILQKIGCQPRKQKGGDIWYNSPFRDEQTASFHINVENNVWYDFGAAQGGDVVAFVCMYLRCNGNDYTVSDALRWIKNMTFVLPAIPAIAKERQTATNDLVIQGIGNIVQPALVHFLSSRGISLSLAQRYLKEVTLVNTLTKRKFYSLGFANEANGFELRNKMFKGCIGKKSISFVRAAKPPATEIHVFEGFMDFLSFLETQRNGAFNGDIIVLNSVANLSQAIPYIKNYTYKTLYSWLDNDRAGVTASQVLRQFLNEDAKIAFRSMNRKYSSHKDVNAWHMKNLGL